MSANQVLFKVFRGRIKSWESLCEEASEFAALIGEHRLISISQSSAPGEGIVTVWFWKKEIQRL